MKNDDPATFAVPLSTPLLVRVKPAGSDPAVTLQTGKPAPPEALST